MRASLFWLLLPAAVLALIVGMLLGFRPLEGLVAAAPPVEAVKVERVRLEPGLISLTARADGSQPVRIAQVQVDGAYRSFTASPRNAVGRLETVNIRIPYPWIDGETHHIRLVTSTGATFEHEIEVAQETPRLTGATLAMLGLIGLLLGVAPVSTGLLSYPALRKAGPGAVRFLLALTVGLLLYLFIDTLSEGLELGAKALDRLRGQTVVWVVTGITAVLLMALARRSGRAPEGVALSGFIALGIGMHNLGEGLAVGAAIAAGEAALATFLVIGFTIHNVTEGVGIAAPLVDARPRLATFAWLAALAGLPAVAGVWLGSQAVNPLITAVCFGIGAGAILQVVIEVAALMVRRGGMPALASPTGAGGVTLGLAVMYATALLV